jgi:protein-L-isoaspartate(D-aspartate) O-methyltransferase
MPTMPFDLEQARQNMVENQVRGWDVLDHRVLNVLSAVPREDFVPNGWRNLAFADLVIPLGHGEVMMKPVVEGRVLQSLALDGSEDVLEIGTGSGFLSACLARLGGHVTSLEFRADFAEAARRRLAAIDVDNVEIVVDDAVRGWRAPRQFDVLVATGAVATVPAPWRQWLKPGGRAFVIRGESPSMQAVLLNAREDGSVTERSLFETDLPYLLHAEPPPRFAL